MAFILLSRTVKVSSGERQDIWGNCDHNSQQFKTYSIDRCSDSCLVILQWSSVVLTVIQWTTDYSKVGVMWSGVVTCWPLSLWKVNGTPAGNYFWDYSATAGNVRNSKTQRCRQSSYFRTPSVVRLPLRAAFLEFLRRILERATHCRRTLRRPDSQSPIPKLSQPCQPWRPKLGKRKWKTKRRNAS